MSLRRATAAKPQPAPLRADPPRSSGRALIAAEVVIGVLLVLVPLALWPAAKDAFRLPKLLLAGLLALLSLVLLALARRLPPAGGARSTLRHPAVLVGLPLLGAAVLSALASSHPLYVREGLLELGLGLAALAGWGLALEGERLRRLLDWLLVSACASAVLGLGQYFNVWQPLSFLGGIEGSRLGVTALAGNPGDLASFLVLPILLAQARLAQLGQRGSWTWRELLWPGLTLGLSTLALAVTQTVTAFVAVVVGSTVLWMLTLTRRQLLRWGGAVAMVLVLALVVVAPLRARLAEKAQQAIDGQWNYLLTGRLDGWRAGLWMFEGNPIAGVGHGAFRAEYGDARLALVERGQKFFRSQQTPVFANAHNEYLEVAATMGLVGLLGLGLGLWVLLRALLRLRARRGESAAAAETFALAGAGSIALALLALTQFPMRDALTGYPVALFLAWLLRSSVERAATDEAAGSRSASGVLAGLLVLALLTTAAGARDRLAASVLLRNAETWSIEAARMGPAGAGVLRGALARLRDAEERDPLEVGIPIALGSVHLLLGSPQVAIEYYEKALALEKRPEIYLNLGRAQLGKGDKEAARTSFATALKLDPLLAPQVPPAFWPTGFEDVRQAPSR